MKLIIDISKDDYIKVQDGRASVSMMRKTIENGTPLEQEPCEDCISREDALMALTGEWTELTDEIIYRFVKRIKSLPLVTPAEKTGRWEWVQYDGNPSIGNWHCSECRTIFIEGIIKREKDSIPFYKYCPQCGAKMKEGD